VATTRWVARDPTADLEGLARELGRYPVLACDLSLARSRYRGLRLYEDFLVKEGVGAGGAAIAAMLARSISTDALMGEIERTYERIYGQDAQSSPVGC
jgi:NaMN:DMB phosphoribosyltransferase